MPRLNFIWWTTTPVNFWQFFLVVTKFLVAATFLDEECSAHQNGDGSDNDGTIFGMPALWHLGGQKRPKFGAISDNFRLLSRILRNGSTYRKSQKYLINYNPPRCRKAVGKLWSTNKKVIGAHIDYRSKCAFSVSWNKFHSPRGSRVRFPWSANRIWRHFWSSLRDWSQLQ